MSDPLAQFRKKPVASGGPQLPKDTDDYIAFNAKDNRPNSPTTRWRP